MEWFGLFYARYKINNDWNFKVVEEKLAVYLQEQYTMSSKEPQTLREALKMGVWKEHEEAENGVFTQAIMKGTITRETYRQFLAELREIYMAIEEMTELNKDNPCFGPIYFPTEMNRLKSLEEDLEFFYGSDWHEKVKPMTESAKEYAARIRDIGKTDPILLVAHSYVRYIGDMSGGQQLKYKLSKHLQLPDSGEGVHFFIFNEIDNIKQFKNFYFGNMNSIEASTEEIEKLVKEAKMAFVFNIKLFKEMSIIAEKLQPQESEGESATENSPNIFTYISNYVNKMIHKPQ